MVSLLGPEGGKAVEVGATDLLIGDLGIEVVHPFARPPEASHFDRPLPSSVVAA